jgi:TetR/AcrR family transcriptional regulator, cholesterol catabolism regulator
MTAILSVYGMDDTPRGKLLSAAARLFREQGYDRTTVRDIAAAVGIQSGSIFHHFSSKEEILFAVTMEVIRFNTERMRQAVASATDPQEQLRGLIRVELQTIVGDTREAMIVLVRDWRCLSADKQKAALAVRAEYEGYWMQVLGVLQAQGRLSTDAMVMRRLINGMTSWTSNWFDESGQLDLDGLADVILRRSVDPA